MNNKKTLSTQSLVVRDKGLEPYSIGIKGSQRWTPKDTQSLAT